MGKYVALVTWDSTEGDPDCDLFDVEARDMDNAFYEGERAAELYLVGLGLHAKQVAEMAVNCVNVHGPYGDIEPAVVRVEGGNAEPVDGNVIVVDLDHAREGQCPFCYAPLNDADECVSCGYDNGRPMDAEELAAHARYVGKGGHLG